MCEPRMELIKKVELMLTGKLDEDSYNIAVAAVTLAIDDFEIQERCTDLTVRKTNNEKLIQAFAGTMMVEGRRKKTVLQYVREAQRFSDFLGKAFGEAGVYDFRKYFADMMNRGVSMRSIENYRSYLSSFYAFLAREEFIERNPMLKIKPIKYHAEQEEPFSQTEIAIMRDTVKDPRDRAIIEFLQATGVRITELVQMRVEDLDMRKGIVHIREGKGGKERTTYMTDICMMYVQNYLGERTSGPLFRSGRGEGPLSDSGVQNMLKKVEKETGIKNIHPHRFRHTFATNSAKGMKVQQVQKLLGHSCLNTTMVYVSTDQEEIKNAYRAMA